MKVVLGLHFVASSVKCLTRQFLANEKGGLFYNSTFSSIIIIIITIIIAYGQDGSMVL